VPIFADLFRVWALPAFLAGGVEFRRFPRFFAAPIAEASDARFAGLLGICAILAISAAGVRGANPEEETAESRSRDLAWTGAIDISTTWRWTWRKSMTFVIIETP
jgi:hypothetical protein